MFFKVVVSWLFLLVGVSCVLLPPPMGPYAVSMFVKALADQNRIDPYSTQLQKRKVLISMFVLVNLNVARCKTRTVPYMTPLVAEEYDQQASAMGLSNDTFSAFRFAVCHAPPQSDCTPQHTKSKEQFPIVLFSPGLGNTRLLYGTIARAISSLGYVVVTIDHPYDASIVEFPDGTVIRAAAINETDPVALKKAVDVRTADVLFVLNELNKNHKMMQSVAGWLTDTIDTSKVVVGGHSLGGAVAASVLHKTSNILGGFNLDGQIPQPTESDSLTRPFFQIGRPDHAKEDGTWDVFWTHLQGPKSELEVEGAVHGTFTDIPALLARASQNLPSPTKEALQAIAGNLKWSKVDRIIGEMVDAVYRYVSDQGVSSILSSKNPEYPEVAVVRKDLKSLPDHQGSVMVTKFESDVGNVRL